MGLPRCRAWHSYDRLVSCGNVVDVRHQRAPPRVYMLINRRDPTVGAQYRWAARYCPSYLPRRFVSFLQGWLTVSLDRKTDDLFAKNDQVFAWVASATLLPYFVGSQILGLVILNYPNYVYEGWHTTLIGYAIVAVPLLFNIFARRLLKAIEIIGAVLTVLFFIVFVVVLVALGNRNSAEYVFTANSGGVSGWTNPTIQWCIGLVSVTFPILGKPRTSNSVKRDLTKA